MNSDEVFGLIESIAATPGKNDKEAMLKKCDTSDLLRKVLKAACDTTITYGVKKIPERTAPGAGQFDAKTWEILDQMRVRALTGTAMQAAILDEINRLGEESAELFKRILLKDLRAGFGENTTNKAFPGLVPDFPYMRCCLPTDTDLSKWDFAGGVIAQEKADGMFFNVDHEDDGEVFLSSRAGSQFPTEKFDEMIGDIQLTFPRSTQSHGEVVVERDGVVLAREIGNGILNSVLKGGDFGPGEKPVLLVWDQIPLTSVKPKGQYLDPYKNRLTGLITQIREAAIGPASLVRLIPTRIVKSLAAAYEYYAELLALGKEGVVLKKMTAIWRDATSKDQVKLKLEFVVDLKIVGFEPGNGKNAATFGSVITETSCGQLRVSVSGFKDAKRKEISDNRAALLGTIMAVKATGVMRPSKEGDLHSLFLPRYVELRKDKTVADTLAQVFAQEEAAKRGAAILKAAA